MLETKLGIIMPLALAVGLSVPTIGCSREREVSGAPPSQKAVGRADLRGYGIDATLAVGVFLSPTGCGTYGIHVQADGASSNYFLEIDGKRADLAGEYARDFYALPEWGKLAERAFVDGCKKVDPNYQQEHSSH